MFHVRWERNRGGAVSVNSHFDFWSLLTSVVVEAVDVEEVVEKREALSDILRQASV